MVSYKTLICSSESVKNSQMDPMEEDDPIQYWSMVNWLMEDDSMPHPFIQMLLADDVEEDDDAEDFGLLMSLLREESAAGPPSLLSDWDNLFSEVDVLDQYGNCHQKHKTLRISIN
jgi:hypothetical protein